MPAGGLGCGGICGWLGTGRWNIGTTKRRDPLRMMSLHISQYLRGGRPGGGSGCGTRPPAQQRCWQRWHHKQPSPKPAGRGAHRGSMMFSVWLVPGKYALSARLMDLSSGPQGGIQGVQELAPNGALDTAQQRKHNTKKETQKIQKNKYNPMGFWCPMEQKVALGTS